MSGKLFEPHEDDANQVIATIPEGQIRGRDVDGDKAFEVWKQYRSLARDSKRWPVVMGDDECVTTLIDSQDTWGEDKAGDILLRAVEADADIWLTERAREDSEYFTSPRGPWPTDVKPMGDFAVLYDLAKGETRASVKLALVPAEHGWQVPALLRFGGWNENPPAEVHCALLKKWEQEYGAELVVMTGDTIECSVLRPPADRDATLRLAQEQFRYCPDIVHQGTQTLEALAAMLLNGRIWYFWWD